MVFIEKGDDFFGNGESYESDVYHNPTWLDVCVIANEMICRTGNFHHVYLEGIHLQEGLLHPSGVLLSIGNAIPEEGVKTARFEMGS